MRNFKLVLSYLGTHYLGWQKTPFGPSIESSLEIALHRIMHITPSLEAASRTDAGVHALNQVVHFLIDHPIEPSVLKKALNSILPKDISVQSVEKMPLSFHSTLDACKKQYWYDLCLGPVQLPFYRNTSWHFPYSLDVEAMRYAAQHFLGSHDFSALCNERFAFERNPICCIEDISIEWLSEHRLRYVIKGDRFLYKMVRNMVGTLIDIGRKKRQEMDISHILLSKDRKKGGVCAPAHGLCLHSIYYSPYSKKINAP